MPEFGVSLEFSNHRTYTPRAMQFFNILVVDDFDRFRALLCLMLQHRVEFDVVQASDGLEAVRRAEELQPDLILLDIGLPKLNGFEACRRIRNLSPDSKILFVSQNRLLRWYKRRYGWERRDTCTSPM